MDGLGNQHNEGAISASDTLSMVSDAGNKDRKPLKQQGIEEWMSLCRMPDWMSLLNPCHHHVN